MTERDVKLEVGLRKAIDWILEMRGRDSRTGLAPLIDEACRKFDLSPLQADFLYRHLTKSPPT
jgi:hypothetical protein